MTATRSRKETKTYDKLIKQRKNHARSDVCEFCEISATSGHDQFIKETAHFKVLQNIFPYSLWDGQQIEDHLMIVPKEHTDSIATFSDAAASEYVKLVGEYESTGYNVYARAPASIIKSVRHQHTHLIKPQQRRIRFIMFLQRPYLRIKL